MRRGDADEEGEEALTVYGYFGSLRSESLVSVNMTMTFFSPSISVSNTFGSSVATMVGLFVSLLRDRSSWTARSVKVPIPIPTARVMSGSVALRMDAVYARFSGDCQLL